MSIADGPILHDPCEMCGGPGAEVRLAEDDVAVALCDACVAVLNEVDTPGVSNHPVPGAPEVTWAHSAVRASFPAGTDPRVALRETLGVFMERTDGTNALEDWQRVRWWHGGRRGLKRGEWLLPPSQTGVMPGLDITDRESVYVTSSRDDAVMYATRFAEPVLYEVTLRQAPLPDDVVDHPSSGRVPTALIVRIEVPSRVELIAALMEIAAPMLDAQQPPLSD